MISVLMPFYNRQEHLKNALEMYEDLYRGLAGGFELCVADDGSADGNRASPAILSGDWSYPIRFSEIPSKGHWRPPSVAINELAYKVSSGAWLAITCPEVVHKDSVLLNLHNAIQEIGEEEKVWFVSACKSHGEKDNSWWQTHPDKRHQPIYYFGAISRKNFFRIGGLKENLQAGGEDGDFTDRLATAGFRLYWLGEVEARHHGKG